MMVEAAVEEERRAELRTEAHTSINRSDEDLTAAGYRRAACGESRPAHGHRAATRSPHLCPGNGPKQTDRNGYRPAATNKADYSSSWFFFFKLGVRQFANR